MKMTLNKEMFLTKEDIAVYKVIDQLTKKEAEVFWLFINGMSVIEIAKGYNRSYSAIATLMCHIRAKFNVKDSHHLVCEVLPATIRRESAEFLIGEEHGTTD